MEIKTDICKWQQIAFHDVVCKKKYISKGRRLGFTIYAMRYAIQKMINNSHLSGTDIYKVLWVDTINSNLDRYLKRYAIPWMRKNKIKYDYLKQSHELIIGNAVMDLRSSDRPENMEGFGYHLIIINEAGIVLKDSSIYHNSILPMFMDYKDAEIIIGGTPKGKRGKLSKLTETGATKQLEEHIFYTLHSGAVKYKDYKKMSEDEKKTVESVSFRFSTYSNPLIDKSKIDEFVRSVPSSIRRQEIDGEFIDSSDYKIFKYEWFKYYSSPPSGIVIQSWDTAFETGKENDFSVCTTWCKTKDGHYLIDCWADRLEYPELLRKVKQLYNQYRPSKLMIEKKSSGHSLIQSLKRETLFPIFEINVSQDKILRAQTASPTFESGKVFFPEKSSWLRDVQDQLVYFPNVEHDDIVDSITQYINNERISNINIQQVNLENNLTNNY